MDKVLLESIKNRIPWSIGSRALKFGGIQTGQGWNRTIEKLLPNNDEDQESVLKDILAEHVVFGEKFTKFYKIEPEDRKALLSYYDSISISDNVFSRAFPRNVPADEFSTSEEPQILVAKYKGDNGRYLVYTSEMKLTSREVISPSEIFSDPDAVRETYDEIIGLKFRSVQLFNVIGISEHDNLLEIRVDNPRGMPSESLHQIHSILKSITNKAIKRKALESAENLFPIIDSVYADENEGKVVELGFTTSTGSVKLEKMRRTRTCLRKELYHVGGKRELKTKIAPYRIAVRWEFGNDAFLYQPELVLAGTSRGTYSTEGLTAAPEVNGVAIANCVGREDYEFVRTKIIKHLGKKPQAQSKAEVLAAQ